VKALKLAIGLCLVLVPLANACSSKPPHEFTDTAGSSGSNTKAGSSNTSGGSDTAHGGSDSGGKTSEAGTAPTTAGDAGAGGEPPTTPPECNAGQKRDCWDLEDGTPIDPVPTVEKGSCHIGQSFCGDDQHWGPCLGAVGPKAVDSCDVAGNDDDCDGVPNEGCTCVNGAKRACGTDTGSCTAGQQTCVAHAWGPCEGEVKPLALDSCETAGNDDNCNGKPNDDCPCVGTATDSCSGGCGTKQCNPAARSWGACTPAASVCVSGTQVKDCTDGGWVTTNCKYACDQDQCTGTCAPGTPRCLTGPERRQVCTDKGVWSTVETCGNGEYCENNGADCVAPCAGKKLCPGNLCAPLGGCCSDSECGGNFKCVNGSCSTDTCQDGFNGPCGGVCTKGCCSVNDCPTHPNTGRSCDGNHQCHYDCKQNYGNCDGNDANGCEVNLVSGVTTGNTISNCGSCGNTCDWHQPDGDFCSVLANICSYGECYAEFKPPGDNNDQYAYKIPVNEPHAALVRGDCDIGGSYDCSPGYYDCDYTNYNGCESQTNSPGPDCNANPFWGGTPP